MTTASGYNFEKHIRRVLQFFFLAAICIVLSFVPQFAHAETDSGLKVSGWIPYWQDTLGTKDAMDNIDAIDTIHPFVFTVKSDGSLSDLGDIDDRKWKKLFDTADDENVEVIPTVMTGEGAKIHTILSNTSMRNKHVAAIMDMVDEYDFDGVDIDYEGKKSETNLFFALFLLELKLQLMQEGKVLSCTIEARTPPEDLYREVPAVLQRANNYPVIGVVCDRIQIMAYDQQRADLTLNDTRKGEPYIPLADKAWVEKMVKYTVEHEGLPAAKIMLGIPTYGHNYMVTVAPDWFKEYGRIGALNPPDIEELQDEYDVEPGRTEGGELAFTYFHKNTPFNILNQLPTPEGTRKGMEAAAKALLFANATGMEVSIRMITYADAGAAEDKIKIAEKYGLRGVAVFKWDGEEDENIWKLFE